MQIWRFYLIKSKTSELDQWRDGTVNILDPVTDGRVAMATREYPLYAITNDKKIAKRFMAERDMSKFIKQSTKHCEKEDWAEFANQNNSAILRYKKLVTASSKKNENGRYIVEVPVLMTEAEYTCVKSESDDEYISDLLGTSFDETMLSPFYIKKKYRNGLTNLKYDSVYFVFHQASPEINLWTPEDVERGMQLYANEGREMLICIDELENFINTYKTLFR